MKEPTKIAFAAKRQNGNILFTASCLVLLIALLGLVIDGGLIYLTKARISMAADSAVLAATDVYTKLAANEPVAQAQAKDAADAYFSASYPANILGSRLTTGKLKIFNAADGVHLRYVATTQRPVTFSYIMRLIDPNSPLTLATITSPETVIPPPPPPVPQDIAILTDYSPSMMPSYNPNFMISTILPSQQYYFSKLYANNSRIMLLPYSFEAAYNHVGGSATFIRLHFDPEKPGFDLKKLQDFNDKMFKCPSSAHEIMPATDQACPPGIYSWSTGTFYALELAKAEFNKLHDGRRHVIFLESDGVPTDCPPGFGGGVESESCIETSTHKIPGLDEATAQYFNDLHQKDGMSMAVILASGSNDSVTPELIKYWACMSGDPTAEKDPSCTVKPEQFSTFCYIPSGSTDLSVLDHCIDRSLGAPPPVLIH